MLDDAAAALSATEFLRTLQASGDPTIAQMLAQAELAVAGRHKEREHA